MSCLTKWAAAVAITGNPDPLRWAITELNVDGVRAALVEQAPKDVHLMAAINTYVGKAKLLQDIDVVGLVIQEALLRGNGAEMLAFGASHLEGLMKATESEVTLTKCRDVMDVLFPVVAPTPSMPKVILTMFPSGAYLGVQHAASP